jgi:hypothetical protein
MLDKRLPEMEAEWQQDIAAMRDALEQGQREAIRRLSERRIHFVFSVSDL